MRILTCHFFLMVTLLFGLNIHADIEKFTLQVNPFDVCIHADSIYGLGWYHIYSFKQKRCLAYFSIVDYHHVTSAFKEARKANKIIEITSESEKAKLIDKTQPLTFTGSEQAKIAMQSIQHSFTIFKKGKTQLKPGCFWTTWHYSSSKVFFSDIPKTWRQKILEINNLPDNAQIKINIQALKNPFDYKDLPASEVFQVIKR